MISRIFIDRPVFAWVIALLIMMAGAFGVAGLAVEQYPDIAPLQVNIRANYPGASAEVLESSVTQVIEQQLTGLDGLLYFQSVSNSAGSLTINVTVDKGVNPDFAQVQVQNKVQQALPRLPQEVQQQGVTVTKSNPDLLTAVALYDETDRASSQEINDLMISDFQETIGRIPGVGDAPSFGSQNAMRIWLDPYKLASFSLMPSDVISALKAQNALIPAGELGGQPAVAGQALNATVTAQSRLSMPQQFEAIDLKVMPDGSRVTLGQVARVQIGAENFGSISRGKGHPGAALSVSLAPGADALKTKELLMTTVDRLKAGLPPGYKVAYPNDTTAFIKVSVREVMETLFEAIFLVVVVMFVFLQSWRATLVPAIAVPVVLLGTFGVLAVTGCSINVLTLFAMVLSIGLLVDDAIVVVENVERVMSENPGMSARDATIISMDQVQTALIAIAMVLSAVFLPMAFFGGSVGVIYRQFSITIVSSMALSVLVALVLSPALTAHLLKPHAATTEHGALDQFLRRYGGAFNRWFHQTALQYGQAVRRVAEHRRMPLIVYGVICVLLAALFGRLPTGFLPQEDQGFARIQLTLPAGTPMQKTLDAAVAVERYFARYEKDNVDGVYMVVGASPQGTAQNAARGFMDYKPWNERKGREGGAEAIAARANKALPAELRDAQVFVLNPPPARGLGLSSGFTIELLNSSGLSRIAFKAKADEVVAEAQDDPDLAAVRLNLLEDRPALQVDFQRDKAGALGVKADDANATITTAWGGSYVNDFIDRNRVKRVYVQGDAPFRSRPEDLSAWFVRTSNGTMAPLSGFADVSWSRSPISLSRFNGISSYEVQGDAAPGRTTGEAMKRMEEIVHKVGGLGVAWSGLSYQERVSGGQAPFLYGVSLLVVFLCLAALYESWSIPLAAILIIPLGLIGATLAVTLRGLGNDVYFQVGLLTTMGLATKNAILIIQFAVAAEKQGLSAIEAAMEGARVRLRPILMTSLAFIFGVLPLAIATGAGAKSRIAIGTAVIGGMLTATALAIFFVPMFYVLVRRFFEPRAEAAAA